MSWQNWMCSFFTFPTSRTKNVCAFWIINTVTLLSFTLQQSLFHLEWTDHLGDCFKSIKGNYLFLANKIWVCKVIFSYAKIYVPKVNLLGASIPAVKERLNTKVSASVVFFIIGMKENPTNRFNFTVCLR